MVLDGAGRSPGINGRCGIVKKADIGLRLSMFTFSAIGQTQYGASLFAGFTVTGTSGFPQAIIINKVSTTATSPGPISRPGALLSSSA